MLYLPLMLFALVVWMKWKSMTKMKAAGLLALAAGCYVNAAILIIMAILVVIPSFERIEKKSGSVIVSSNEVIELLSAKSVDLEKLAAAAKEYKRMLNTTGNDLFRRIKYYAVKTVGRNMDEPSRGSFKLREIISYMSRHAHALTGDFVDLCAGSGGWSQVMHEMGNRGTAISFWSIHEKHAQWKGPEGVDKITSDIGDVKPFETDVLLCDGGEADVNYDMEGSRHAKLLNKVCKWLEKSPGCEFVIKVLAPGHADVIKALEKMQDITGKGRLIRLRASRLSSNEAYFVSLDARPVHREAYSLLNYLMSSWSKALRDPPEEKQLDYVERTPVWDQPDSYAGVKKLQAFPMDEALSEVTTGRTMFPARNITKFLKETGYFIVQSIGSNNSLRNSLVAKLLGPLVSRMQGLSDWKLTSTTARATFDVMMNKVDEAPVETHEYWPWMKIAYEEMAIYLKELGHRLRLSTQEEIMKAVNPKGAMGLQEHEITSSTGRKFAFPNIGEYAKFVDDDGEFLWWKRVKDLIRSFEIGKPKLAVFNSVLKKEKKRDLTQHKQKGSRLIWFMPATMRMFETYVFGQAEEVIKHLPFSVCGLPLYDFGEKIAQKFTSGRKAIADDIAGWDMRVPHGCLVLECMFWKMLATTKTHRKYIEWLYRIYSNSVVMIAREIVAGIIEMVIYWVYGKVCSGRRVTYTGNTVTNAARCMVQAAISQKITLAEFRKWVRIVLRQDTDMFGGAIAGDDNALVFGAEQAEQYATEAFKVSNKMGFKRKDIPLEEKSTVLNRMDDVDFCSNNFTQITYETNMGKITRWMPIRPLTEIFAKAMLTMAPGRDKTTEDAWAKSQALNLLVNYHHLPEARALGLMILSVVDPNVVLLGLNAGWSYQTRPWITDGNVLNIISGCLFGKGTTIPSMQKGAKIESIRKLGQVDSLTRKRFGGLKRKLRLVWYESLAVSMSEIRKPGCVYENWYMHMSPLARECDK